MITCTGHTSVFSCRFWIMRELDMKDFNVSITHTTRRRKLRGGKVARYDHYCEYKDPLTCKRRRRLQSPEDAEAFRNALPPGGRGGFMMSARPHHVPGH